jgi:hypothetical protein
LQTRQVAGKVLKNLLADKKMSTKVRYKTPGKR